jgi:predicted dehydrogenase/glycosyltransferase involved in cell wall biosynthesis
MLKAAVIGCGTRGTEHAQVLKNVSGIELVAMGGRTPEAVSRATAPLDVPGYLALEELMERARPEIVVLATPAHGRAALTERVAGFAGVRAIVAEKPMALTLAEAEQMLAICEARGIMLTVSHQWRFSTELVAIKAAIDAGELGAVEFLRGSCYGNLLRQGVHILDAMRWLAGDRDLLWVMSQWSDDPHLLARYTRGDQGYWDDAAHPAPMWMTHHLAFEGGLRATMETGLLYQRSRSFSGDWLQKRLTVIGADGLAECQTGGEFKLLSAKRSGWTRGEGSAKGHLDATHAFHEALRDALRTAVPHRNDAHDAIKSFEAVLACAQSAVDGNLAVLPVARDRDPLAELEALRRAARPSVSLPQTRRAEPAPTRADPAPDVSVIVGLPDHRGLALECIRSLTQQQSYSRERFEVIVATDGSDPELDSRVNALLRPRDRMIRHATPSLYLLYHLGAREARGKLLFFTESHCIVEPECIEELVKFFATHDHDGARCRIIGICPTFIARMQERSVSEALRIGLQPDHWQRVNILGFAIYRQIYHDEGGFQTDCYRFADLAFGATLHSRGHRIGYAVGATVRHCYFSTFRELFAFIRTFTRGECTSRARLPVEYCERYFGSADDWTRRESLRPSVAQAICRAGWHALWREGLRRRTWSMAHVQVQALLRSLPVALFGPRWRLLEYRWLLLAAMARCWLWRFNEKRLSRAYLDVEDRMIRHSRLAFIAERLAAPPPAPPQVTELRPAKIGEEWLVGFHAIERWEGEAFRWTGPVALLRLGLPQGSYEVRIDTRAVRRASDPLCLGIFFNHHRVPGLQWQDGTLSFRVQPSMFAPGPEQHLILTCNPLRPWKQGVPDRRELGLPIFAVSFAPVTATVVARKDTTAVAASQNQAASSAARLSSR